MASSFDCPGPMAKTVEDCQTIFEIIRGEDPHDATSSSVDLSVAIPDGPIKVGIPKEYFAKGVDDEIKEITLQAAKTLEKEGYILKEISLPYTQYAVPTYYVLIFSEISSNLARYDGIRFGKERSFFEDEAKRRIMIGTYTLSAGYFDQYYLQASKVRKLIQQDFKEAFGKVDVILGPVSPIPPFKLGEKVDDPVAMYLADILTVSANLAGIPGLALPCGFTQNNLPVGMQLLGLHFSENLLFKVGKDFQAITDYHKRRPNL
jgi:aspartyl-tRNA(Asn)/glutamyl-tRNA(Gln) amidotransferase subunit A